MSNKLERAIESWKTLDAKYEQLFSPAVINSRAFKTERLRQLNVIASRFSGVDTDRTILEGLKIERRLLERQINIGFIKKWAYRMIDAFSARKQEAQEIRAAESNVTAISERLRKAGFGNHIEEVLSRIKESGKPFSISHSVYISPKERMDYQLQFKPEADGKMNFEGYKASLTNLDTREHRSQTYLFNGQDITNGWMAASLLQGKAIQLPKPTGQRIAEWVQYDMTDKDAAGNFRLVRFDEKREQLMMDAISRLPTKERLTPEKQEELMVKLGMGKDVKVTLSSDKGELDAIIKANPRQGNVIVMNKDGKVLDPARMGEKSQRESVAQQTELKEKRVAKMRVVR